MSRVDPSASSTDGRTAIQRVCPPSLPNWSTSRSTLSSAALAHRPPLRRRRPRQRSRSYSSVPATPWVRDWPSLAHPGGNAAGLVNQSQDIAGKQMERLKEVGPNLSRMGVLWRPSNPSYRNLIRRFDDVVRATGVEVVLISAESAGDLMTAFETMKKEQINGLLVQADALFIQEGKRIVELAADYRIPAIYRLGEHAEAGGLMAYGPSIPYMYRQGALLVDRILRGAKADDLPDEERTKIELVINLKTAKALGITVPLSLLARADEVIE